MYETPTPQSLRSESPHDYTVRCIVAGTRHYNNMREFHEGVCSFLHELHAPVLFISGAARSGADDLIIRWCQRFGYPCLQMPADWSEGRGAGFARNTSMAAVATHLLAFHDGHSPGTQHMIEQAVSKRLRVKTLRVRVPT
jgi:hypothetical protein